MIIDSHVHMGISLFGKETEPQRLIKEMDGLGINKAVIIPFKPFNYHLEPENFLIFHLIKQYPHRFIGFGRIDPWRKETALLELERIFHQYKFHGIFLHPLEEHFQITDEILKPIFEFMVKIQKPLMISGGHARFSHPRQIQYIAEKYPPLKIIATSGGQINICGLSMEDAEDMLRKCPNVYMESSGIYRRDFIEKMTEILGAERIIFGSGSPYFQQNMEIERIKTAEIDDDKKKKILGDNLTRLIENERHSG